MAETSVWVRLMRRGKITGQATEPCAREDAAAALNAICERLDISKPIWLPHNLREWEYFSLTRFLPGQFIDSVSFDRMELTWINADAKPAVNRDPRNA